MASYRKNRIKLRLSNMECNQESDIIFLIYQHKIETTERAFEGDSIYNNISRLDCILSSTKCAHLIYFNWTWSETLHYITLVMIYNS